MELNTPKFLVLGSNSFSGAHFITELLEEENIVCGVSRSKEPKSFFLPYKWPRRQHPKGLANNSNFTHYSIDINKDLSGLLELIDHFQPQYVVNFAALGMVSESWKNPTHWYQTNTLSQVAFHDELRKRVFLKKYLHFSTPEVYGNTGDHWTRENNNFAPTTPYAVSRAACDLHLHSFYKAYQFPVVFTRAANVYGPGQQLFRIIPKTMLSARTGRSLKLHGGGVSERSFIHIKDVVKATKQLLLKADPGSSWHISTKNSISIKDLVQRICNMTNITFASIIEESAERLGKDKSYLLDSSAIRNQFQWEDKISLTDGLNDTLTWIDENLAKLIKLPWEYNHKP